MYQLEPDKLPNQTAAQTRAVESPVEACMTDAGNVGA